MTAVDGRPSLDLAGELAAQLRVDALRCSTRAGAGHPTSALSAADVVAVLLARHMRCDWRRPEADGNDYLLFSKGHACLLLYAGLRAVGAIDEEELLSYRAAGSRLGGHPTPALPWVPVATGSLGLGLPVGVGIALAGRELERASFRVWVLCGDGELAEGSMWEALDAGATRGLSNLTALVDVNGLGQRGPTAHGGDTATLRRRLEAFGWSAIEIDGHDLAQIDAALADAATADRPTAVLARTVKGKGVPAIEDRVAWHGKALPSDMAEPAISALGGVRHLRVGSLEPDQPSDRSPRRLPAHTTVAWPTYSVGERESTRRAYGCALAALGARPDVVALDADMSTSTFSCLFAEAHSDRFVEVFIAEQLMVAVAMGIAERGWSVYCSTYAAFLARAFDAVRMAGVSRSRLHLTGSHAGTETGGDGPSQMGLEDIAAMRAICGSTVLHPADATATVRLLEATEDAPGIVYLRTTRNPRPVLYRADAAFRVGGSHLLRASSADDVTLVGTGVTVHHCLQAAERLAGEGVRARVVDAYSLKPIDAGTLRACATATCGRIVTVEDHYPEGGLAAAVLEALADAGLELHVRQLAVRALPGQGSANELQSAGGIDADAIVDAALGVCSADAHPHSLGLVGDGTA